MLGFSFSFTKMMSLKHSKDLGKNHHRHNAPNMAIRSDQGGEFIDECFVEYSEKKVTKHQLSSPRTPKQNGVVKKMNRFLIEMTITLVND